MSEQLSRRSFLKGGIATGAGVVAGSLSAIGGVQAASSNQITDLTVGATLPYPRKVVAKSKALSASAPTAFNYPDASSPCQLIKMGKAVDGGVGPDGDIVAYSVLCTHQGCPVNYDVATGVFKCPCHYSQFDAEKTGQMVCGQAPSKLPRIVLEYDAATDTVSAVAVDGLIYGRQANII